MNKIFIYLIFVLTFSSLCFAQSYKVNTDIDLKVPCITDDDICSEITTCNISITSPTSETLVSNQAMTNSEAFFNYTFNETSKIGKYNVFVYCSDNTNTGSTFYDFDINNNGLDNSNNSIGFIVALVTLVALCLIIGYNIPTEPEYKPLKLLFLLFGFIFAFLIPASFIITTVQGIFYSTFVWFLRILAMYFFIYAFLWAVKKFEVH